MIKYPFLVDARTMLLKKFFNYKFETNKGKYKLIKYKYELPVWLIKVSIKFNCQLNI